jgi:RHS repeat-associated protein
MTIKKLFATAMLALALAIGAQPTAAEPNRTFTYDRAGNTLSDSRRYTATYNLRGQLATITKAGITTTYTYNAKGQRVRKASSRGPAYTVTFVYDKEGHLLGEYDHTGEALREYVWLRDTPMVVFTPDPANPPGDPLVYFIHTDHLNTPRVVIDRNNVVRWRWISEPFGTTAPETNPSGLGDFTFNLRFPGQYADQESGLFYNYRRNYDKETGRYRESDPIGLQGGINTYAYVDGNPLGLVDPNGLDRWGPDPVFDWRTKNGVPQPNEGGSTAELYVFSMCMRSCVGEQFTITSAAEAIPQHRIGTPHRSGQAIDVRYPAKPDKYLCCAQACGAKFALDEAQHPSARATGQHFHLQTTPGQRGGRGDLPAGGTCYAACEAPW